ncbi:hypothetical protein A33Q_4587 [Indibacter alkaliphilus LW1]|uniref:DUF4221 domain-containing protein n=1 Tax=Indibacter alkaliphilus (strain CCUG 57479 / KCTC 22604 / LW1) TaxID=1189612 RepID=S2CY59_INDAL|nr:DUF4221 family protein [Indibacter alkaliphilus]EOZ91519.1 hypothetical protein A33Q_4587 [Indibacter alkaliphilus LW1]
MFKYYLKAIVILFFCSCGRSNDIEKNKDKESSQKNSFEFERIGTKKFPLDSTTAGGGSNFQYVENEGKKLLCYLNTNQNTLIFYDYEQETLEYQLSIEKKGPNGVGEISGFLVHSTDSIFVYSNSGVRLYHLNQSGKIINIYDPKAKEDGLIIRPYVSGSMPMMKRGKHIILNSWGSQKEYYNNDTYPESLLLRVNLETKEMDYGFSYPEIYTKGVWGMQLHVMYNMLNPETSEIVVGFPIDDHLYVLGEGYVKKHPQGSKYFKGVVPLSTKSKISPPPPNQEVQNERSQTTYRTIHYDPYNEIYIRVVHKAISEEVLAMNDPVKSVFPKASLMIMDKEFKKLGEVDFDNNDYWINNIFINENGIHIMKMDFVNEDVLTFDVFDLKFPGTGKN